VIVRRCLQHFSLSTLRALALSSVGCGTGEEGQSMGLHDLASHWVGWFAAIQRYNSGFRCATLSKRFSSVQKDNSTSTCPHLNNLPTLKTLFFLNKSVLYPYKKNFFRESIKILNPTTLNLRKNKHQKSSVPNILGSHPKSSSPTGTTHTLTTPTLIWGVRWGW